MRWPLTIESVAARTSSTRQRIHVTRLMLNPDIQSVLPMTADVSSDGELTIGGVPVSELAAQHGTPLYIYDAATIRGMCRAFVDAFTGRYADSTIEYSSKAFSNPAILQLVQSEGLSLDVVTGGELAIAMAARFPADHINFHGNNKTRDELTEALEAGLGRITIDSFHEIELLNEVAGEVGIRQAAMLRLSPSVDPHTHRLTSTGVLDSKFGFSIETGDAERAVEIALRQPNLEIMGLHFHLGSPLFELEPYDEAVHYVIDFAKQMHDSYGFQLREFNPGGGMAVGYVSDTLPPSIDDYARTIADAIVSACERNAMPLPALTVEPGRSIVGRAGVAVYTVGGIKRIPGVRTYVSVDGGMGDNIRPALYDSRYEVLSVREPAAAATETVTIAGKYCESGDVLARDVQVPPLAPGDLVALPASGAYNLAMASNYNMQPRPAVLLIGMQGDARVIRRRETYADLLATAVYE